MTNIKKLARGAGVLYALDALIASAGFLFDPSKLVDATSMSGAADHIVAAQSMIRLDMLSEVTYQTIEVFLAVQLYLLFRPTSNVLAKQMLALALIPIPIAFANLLTEVGALLFAGDPFVTAVLAAPQRDAISGVLLRLHGQGLDVAGIFWGLWLIPFGLLIVRCGFIPKVFGFCSMVGGLGYLLGSGASLIMPGLISPSLAARCSHIADLLEMGELPAIVWLLIYGVKSPTYGKR